MVSVMPHPGRGLRYFPQTQQGLADAPVAIDGIGDLTAPAAAVDATAVLSFTGTADATAVSPLLSLIGTETFSGSGAVTAAPASVDSAGSIGISGSASATAPSPLISAAAAETFAGTAGVLASTASVAAAGYQTFAGSATAIAPPASVVGAGSEIIAGTAAVSAASSSVAGVGTLLFTGSITEIAASPTLAALGTVGALIDIVGTSVNTTAAALVQGTGEVSSGGVVTPPMTDTGLRRSCCSPLRRQTINRI